MLHRFRDKGIEMKQLALVAILMMVPLSTQAEQEHHSSYSGMQVREIKSFSNDDVEQLRAGHGWGLSLVAELNGVPGPKHVLELQEELGLSSEQITRIQAVFDRMKQNAVPLGEELIRLERRLDRSFAGGTMDEKSLRKQLSDIADARRDLRYTHLAAHLATPDILTEEQVRQYSSLRGYDGGDPCASVPPGHNAAMWRSHNGCD